MAVDTRAKQFQKIFESGFQKARFWTLDDDSRSEIFLEVMPLCPVFYIEGWEESSTWWKGGSLMEVQSKKISNYRCHFARFFTLIGEGIKQWAGKGAVSRNSETKPLVTGVILPLIPHIGVAGITPDRRKDGNDDEHKTKCRRNPAAHEKSGMG